MTLLPDVLVIRGDSGSRDGNGDPSFAPPLLEQDRCIKRGMKKGKGKRVKRGEGAVERPGPLSRPGARN